MVNNKDDPRNQILLISTGLVDKLGYVSGPADEFMFDCVEKLLTSGLTFAPTHLNQVILHHWPSHKIAVLYERQNSSVLLNTSQ